MFRATKKGTWWFYSKSDPRWNVSGKALVGGFLIPPEAKEVLADLRELYSKDDTIPEDLEFGYRKD
jgi:hypothetical protein